MARLNINLAPEFQDNLQKFTRLRGIASKSEAVRLAVKETVERETTKKPKTDWRALIGWANQFPENPNFDRIRTEYLWRGNRFCSNDCFARTIAAQARHTFRINLGDCFAYALAVTENLTLLTLDSDFRAVDIPVILPPGE